MTGVAIFATPAGNCELSLSSVIGQLFRCFARQGRIEVLTDRPKITADALPIIRAKLNSELDEYKRWESVTVATAFENPADGVLDLEAILN